MEYCLQNCVWEITLACCFNCQYCGSKAGKARENELSLMECFKVVDELKELGCERISLIGGEVFMRKDWYIIVKKIISEGIKCAIITNGWLFNERELKLLKELNVESIAVSLDGIKEVHDKYRAKGSYERARKCVFSLAENHIPVSLITTLNSENSKTLYEFYADIRNWPIFAWQIQACSPMGNASDSFDYKFNVKEVLDFVKEVYSKAPFRIQLGDNIGYYSDIEEYIRGSRIGGFTFTGCGAGLDGIGIDSVGNIKGCESLYDDIFIEGNIRERSIKDIWEDENSFAYNRKFKLSDLTGKCANCSENYRCAGGCRSYNYFTHKRLYESLICNKE